MVESDSADSVGPDFEPARPTKRARGSRSRAPLGAAARGVSAGTGSVCQLFVKKAPCNYVDPWRKHGQQSATGTGFLVSGRWIVTNAHVVHRAVSVLVRSTTGPPIKYNARVVSVGLPCDLAVLAVDDGFWSNKESLTLSSELPRLDDNVTCIGFPVGGENISVTRGVVSRIDVNHIGLLRIQIDAAINPGNSGGPVVGKHGCVVGVAASHLKNASNIGYIIPTAVLEQFLQCINAPGRSYMGVASLGISRVQTLESPALRRHLGLPDGFTGGVRVPAVLPLGPAAGKLRVDDVLLSLDGIEIGQDGTVPLRDNERINFLYLVTRHLAGHDSAQLLVWRKGVEIELEVPLRPDSWLVPRIDGFDASPEYLVVGGLVFVPLSQPWAELKGNDKNARVLINHYWGLALPEVGKQVVILSKVLAHPCNIGFHSLGNVVLDAFHGEPVHNLSQLAHAVASCRSETLVFEFLRPTGDGKDVVALDRAECAAAEAEVLRQHLIAVTCMVRSDGQGEPQPLAVELGSTGKDIEDNAASGDRCMVGVQQGDACGNPPLVPPAEAVALEPSEVPSGPAASGRD